MSSFLYRLAHAVTARARRVLALWLVLLVAAGALAGAFGGKLQDNLTIPGTEAQDGLDVLAHRFPEVAGTSGQVLFVAPEGHRVEEYDGQVRAVLKRVRAVDHVAVVTDPFEDTPAGRLSVSPDHGDALAQVQLDVPLDRLDPGTVDALERAATPSADSPVQVHLGGSIFTNRSVQVSATEGLGVLVALAVLALTFGSLLAAGMPILTAVIGVGVAMAGILLTAGVADINTSTPTLALMIGLAVGIDYALFIVSRHRSQLAEGMPVRDSVARALATAGSAVIFAGTTVVIALCGLVVARIPFLAVMGYAAAAAVAVAVLVALTAVPAMLALAGERLRPRPGSRAARTAVVRPRRDAHPRRPLGRPGDEAAGAHGRAGHGAAGGDGAAGQGPGAGPARQRHRRARVDRADDVRPGRPRLRTRLQRAAAGHHRHHPYDGPGRRHGQTGQGPRAARRGPRGRPGHPQPDRRPGHRAGGPGAVADRPGHRRPGPRDPRRPRRAGAALRHHRPEGDRADRGDHRRLRPAPGRAAAVRAGRGRAVAGAADRGVPLGRGAAQGDAGLPALGRGVVRRGDRGLRVGLAGRRAQRAQGRPGDLVPADPADGGAVRPGDGLRGLPGQPDARGLRAHRRRAPLGAHRVHRQRPGGHRRRGDHDQRLRRVRPARRRGRPSRSRSAWPSASSSTRSWSG